MTNVNNPPVVEEPKAAEKPTLVLSIGSGTYPIFLKDKGTVLRKTKG